MVLDSNFFSSIFAFLVLVYWIMHMVGFCCDFLSCNQFLSMSIVFRKVLNVAIWGLYRLEMGILMGLKI